MGEDFEEIENIYPNIDDNIKEKDLTKHVKLDDAHERNKSDHLKKMMHSNKYLEPYRDDLKSSNEKDIDVKMEEIYKQNENFEKINPLKKSNPKMKISSKDDFANIVPKEVSSGLKAVKQESILSNKRRPLPNVNTNTGPERGI